MAELNMQDVDLYELLGISSSSSVAEVKKAYRKKALTCHPDKNPDNPRAAELFHQLSKALEILIDESARAAYDRVLNGKKAAKLRHRELDEKRKKLKEDLEARERAAANLSTGKKVDTRTDEEKLQAEIQRLRKEGSKQVEEEVEFIRKQVQQESQAPPPEEAGSSGANRLRIRWKANKDDPNNGGYPYETLLKIMSKYGDIVALVVSPKKNGSALIEFKTKDAADTAYALEKGFLTNPLTFERLVGDSSKTNSHESDGQPAKLSDLTKSDELRSGIPTATLFPSLNPSGNHIHSSLQNFASAPDFSQLLYANYLTGQQLRYPNCMAVPPQHSYPAPTQAAQMMLPGAMMLPGMAGVGLSSVMGYGHIPQYPTYASHPTNYSLPGYPNSLQYVTAGAPLVAGSRATYAAGLPMFRGHLPGAGSGAGAAAAGYPSLAGSAHLFYPQLLSGLPAMIPR